MQFVVVLEIDDKELDGVEDIEHGCSMANYAFLVANDEGLSPRNMSVRPLSEVLAC